MSEYLHNDRVSIGSTGILKNDEATARPLSFAYPRCFEDVLNALDERRKNRYGEDAKLWDDLQIAKADRDVERLLSDEYSIDTSHTAYVTTVPFDLGIPTNLLWNNPSEERWKEPSVHPSSAYVTHPLIRSKGTKQFLSLPSPATPIHESRIMKLSTP